MNWFTRATRCAQPMHLVPAAPDGGGTGEKFSRAPHTTGALIVWGAGGSSMRRSIAEILAVINALNGLTMLFAGPFWWATVPGVADTGPFNPHFVQDVGAAFLAAGLALGA